MKDKIKNIKGDWVECVLGEVFNFIGGGTPSKSNSDYWNGKIPWASIKDLKGNYLLRTKDFITEKGLNNSSANIASKGDIILATRINPGTPILSKIETAINQDLKIAKPKIKSEIDYLFWLLNTLKPRVVKLSSGTTVLGINLTNLRAIQVRLPPLPIQRAIVKKIEHLFSSLDSGIADLQQAQAQLKIYRQAVLKKVFEGELTKEWRKNNKGVETNGRSSLLLEQIKQERQNHYNQQIDGCKNAFEGEWQLISVGGLFDFIGGGTPSKRESDYWNGDIPWASVKDIKGDYLVKTQDFITEKGLKNSSANLALKDEVILITRISPGKSLITTIDTAINQDLKIIKPKTEMFNKFIHYLFRSIERKCVKLSSGTTVKGINLSNLKSIEIPIISPQEQTQIVQQIESRLSVCDKVEQSITQSLEKAKALRQSILKKAFEGKLLSAAEIAECKKAKDYEPASVLLEKIRAEKLANQPLNKTTKKRKK